MLETKEVIAKFRLTCTKTDTSKSKEHPIFYDLEFCPVTCGSPENTKFFQLTPWGSIHLGTLNEEAAKFFIESMDDLGKAEFYVIFRKASS